MSLRPSLFSTMFVVEARQASRSAAFRLSHCKELRGETTTQQFVCTEHILIATTSPPLTLFQSPDGAIQGLQISLKLCNVCAYQDRIFVVLFGNMPAAAAAASSSGTAPPPPPAVSGTVSGAHDIQTVFGSTGSKWTQISRTEVAARYCIYLYTCDQCVY